jgi:3-hydroxybutyryl-CoA dehydrogenase
MRAETTQFSGPALISGLLVDARQMAASSFASTRDIDVAMRLGAGYPIGPFNLADDELWAEDPVAAADNPWPGEIGVVGTGHMATGIAEAIARAGQPVVLCGRTALSVSTALAGVADRLDISVARGRDIEADARAVIERIRGVDDLDALSASPVVIEAVVEDLEIKQAVFAALDTRLPQAVRLATNTSSFRVAEVTKEVASGRTVLALHFFNPAQRMRLVEIVAPDAPALRQDAADWIRSLGKKPVDSGDQRGFIVNRLLIPFLNDCVHELEHGASVGQIDHIATTQLGHPMGPFALIDLIGIDVTVAALRSMAEQDPDPRLRPAPELERMLAAGNLGRKTGRGFVVGIPNQGLPS